MKNEWFYTKLHDYWIMVIIVVVFILFVVPLSFSAASKVLIKVQSANLATCIVPDLSLGAAIENNGDTYRVVDVTNYNYQKVVVIQFKKI